MSKPTSAFYNRFSIFYPFVDMILKPQKKRLFSEVNSLPKGTQDPLIGQAKDLASGAALVVCLFTVICAGIIYIPYLF